MFALRPLLIAVLATGCNIARIVDKQTMTTMAPQVMANPDVGLGCATGAAMAPVLSALGKDGNRPDKSLVLTYMSAAMCAEPLAWDTELRRMQAVRELRGGAVTDLLEVERRHHSIAASRYLAAWTHLERAYGPLGEACPVLDNRKNDHLLFLLGLSSGLLAVVHDQAGGTQVGVPLDISRKVERAAGCLDNQTWWGVPRAMQAAVWASVPGAAPEGKDPIATLAESAAIGDAAGVFLARAFQAQTLATVGKLDDLAAAVTAHSESTSKPGVSKDYRLLNSYAGQLIRHESDKVWMGAAGHRTPSAQYGTFPPKPGAADEPDGFDDLLDSLIPLDPAPASDAPPPPENNQ